jgi:hypothetical protein
MKKSEYTPEEVANRIASKTKGIDKFSKHVADGGRQCCRKHGRGHVRDMRTRVGYRQAIVKMMKASDTKCFRGSHGDLYYQRKTNLFAFVDRKNLERSTAYSPKKGQAYFKKKISDENEARRGRGQKNVRVARGGHTALMKQQQKVKSQTRTQQPTHTAKPKPKSAKLTRLTQGRSAAKARIKSETRSENRSVAPKPQKSKAARIAGGKRSKAAPAAKRTKAVAPSKAKPAAAKSKSKAARISGGRSPSSSRSEGRTAKPSRARTQTRSKD